MNIHQTSHTPSLSSATSALSTHQVIGLSQVRALFKFKLHICACSVVAPAVPFDPSLPTTWLPIANSAQTSLSGLGSNDSLNIPGNAPTSRQRPDYVFIGYLHVHNRCANQNAKRDKGRLASTKFIHTINDKHQRRDRSHSLQHTKIM